MTVDSKPDRASLPFGFTTLSCAVVFCVGVCVLAGWLFDIAILTTFVPGWVSMKFNTALCLVLTSISLCLCPRQDFDSVSARARRLSIILACVVLGIALLSMTQYVSGLDLVVDRLFFIERASYGPGIPNRMALNTALSFIFIAVSVLFFHRHSEKHLIWAYVLSGLSGFFPLAAMIGFAASVSSLVSLTSFVPMAMNTAASLLLLAIGAQALGRRFKSVDILFTRKLVTGFGLALLLIAFVGFISYQSIRDLQEATRRLRQTNAMMDTGSDLESSLAGAESARRGYAFTQNISFLRRFEEDSAGVRAHLHALQALTAGKPAQQQRLTALVSDVEARLADMQLAMEAQNSKKVSLAGEAKRINVSFPASEKIRRELREFRAEEKRFLEERQAQVDASTSRTVHLILFSCALFLLTIVPAAWSLRAAYLSRQRAEAELRSVNATLESRVEERTAVLTRTLEELRENRERLASIVDSAMDAILSVDETQTIVLFNAAAEKMFGVAEREALGSPLDRFIPARWRESHRTHVRGFGETGVTSRSMAVLGSISGLRADGTEFPIEASISQVIVGGRKLFTVILRDITERKHADEAIRALNQELEQRVRRRTAELEAANKELEAFCYSISHDLRAPLRHADGFSRILLEDCGNELSAEAKRLLDRIRTSTRNMGELIDDLLHLSRVGRAPLSIGMHPLAEILNEARQLLEPDLHGREIEWRIGPLPRVKCDAGLMRQVFVNLLSNAIKYTRRCPRAILEIGTQAHNGETAIFVRDNGAGFDMKYAGKLFGVFQRLHHTDEFEGTGVGLATVQRIIHKHGGRIWAESQPGQGATFFFTIGDASALANESTDGGALTGAVKSRKGNN